MPKSMTGFARFDQSTDWGNLVCELKSVNHRFLDLGFRMPDPLRSIEHELREQVRGELARGKVEVSLSMKVASSGSAAPHLDRAAAAQYIAAANELAELMGSKYEASPYDLLQLPGVMQTTDVDTENLKADARLALAEALQRLNTAREREGAAMAQEILNRTERMSKLTHDLREVVPAIRQNQEDRLRQRIADADIEINADRLEQELIILAQKMDVDEEIDRLNAHLQQLEKLAKSNRPVGREMDFLMQELNREANTLGSKSQGLGQTNISVEMKVLIEQMREQIQNLE